MATCLSKSEQKDQHVGIIPAHLMKVSARDQRATVETYDD